MSEILPVDWNANSEIYSINYTLDSKGYELKILLAEDTLIINLLVKFELKLIKFKTNSIFYQQKKSNERTANFSCRLGDHVTGINREFQQYYKN